MQQRAITLQRQQLVRERRRLAAMGRSLLAMYNIHVTGKWWKGKTWTAVKILTPAWVIEQLEVFIVKPGPVGGAGSEIDEGDSGSGPRTEDPKRRGAVDL